MASAASTGPKFKFKQEMPPEGGFAAINHKRIPSARFLTAPKLWIGSTISSVIWAYFYRINVHEVRAQELENRSGHIALEPLLIAERDREYLKQLRKNRDDERELMKNVEGWEVGTYYGEPIFKTISDEILWEPMMTEYYAHTSFKALCEYFHFRHYY